MKNISEKLMINLTKLTELETSNLQIKSAIFVRRINETIESSLKKIELRLDEEIVFFGQKPDNYAEYKNLTLQEYTKEFKKISEEYELQYINICEELQEAYANQKISIANCKKIKNLKDEFLASEQYQEYEKIKQKYKEDMDNSLNKVEFEENMNLLKNLKNPIEDYDNKIKASIIKSRNYEIIIEKCIQKMNECEQNSIDELNNIVTRKTSQLQVYGQTNIFSKILNKITNIFNGKKKLKMYVIDKTELELQKLKIETDTMQESTRNNTIKFIEQLIGLREEFNNKFNEIINT